MEKDLTEVLTLPADAVPPLLVDWLNVFGASAMLVSLERLDDGRVVLQTLPDVDPTLVARIRKILAQHADVLRRLT